MSEEFYIGLNLFSVFLAWDFLLRSPYSIPQISDLWYLFSLLFADSMV